MDLGKSLIEHNIICGIEHIVAVPVHSCQKLWENKEKHAVILIHDRHGLTSLQIINYPNYIPFVATAEDYKEYIFNEGIGEKTIFLKSDGYPMQIVQLKSIEYLYACTTNGLCCDQREAQNGSRSMGRQ